MMNWRRVAPRAGTRICARIRSKVSVFPTPAVPIALINGLLDWPTPQQSTIRSSLPCPTHNLSLQRWSSLVASTFVKLCVDLGETCAPVNQLDLVQEERRAVIPAMMQRKRRVERQACRSRGLAWAAKVRDDKELPVSPGSGNHMRAHFTSWLFPNGGGYSNHGQCNPLPVNHVVHSGRPIPRSAVRFAEHRRSCALRQRRTAAH